MTMQLNLFWYTLEDTMHTECVAVWLYSWNTRSSINMQMHASVTSLVFFMVSQLTTTEIRGGSCQLQKPVQ